MALLCPFFLSGDVAKTLLDESGKTGLTADVIQIQGTVIKVEADKLTVRSSMANEKHHDGARLVSIVATIPKERIKKYEIPKIDVASGSIGWMIELGNLEETTIETWKRIKKIAPTNGG